ncbi:MAG: Gfo/Idh/MocA family oxidoreductase [Chloroflexi bacterium]|nr:Gfo/Idh/MocA family oxidoreductase [Chloroflexota bacterium]
MRSPVEAVVIGAGGRGARAYGAYALRHPDRVKIVAVAEPNPERRDRFARDHGISPDNVFHGWEELMARPQIAPALINTTMDRTHLDSSLAALGAGYDVLLEKPMATSAADCVRIVQAAEDAGRLLQICHVLRYTPFFRKLKSLLASGALGEVVTVMHNEHVAYWHIAHSYVRGNWRNSELATPMLLSKSCHDLDILVWMLGQRCKRVASFGELRHFRLENAPPGAPDRCTDGCPVESECPHYAPRLYFDVPEGSSIGRAISNDPSLEGRMQALREGPYGRCVFRCDNNVVDHQVVMMEFEDGVTVSFTMEGHSHDNVRAMRYSGTRATVRGHTGFNQLLLHDYVSGGEERLVPESVMGGHGGGDWGLMDAFVDAVEGRRNPETSAYNSLESHLIGYAAEHARLTGTVVEMEEFRRQAYADAKAAVPV